MFLRITLVKRLRKNLLDKFKTKNQITHGKITL